MVDRYNEEIEKMHEEEKWFLAQHPVCVICQEKIQDGTAFYNRKIGYICNGCIEASISGIISE